MTGAHELYGHRFHEDPGRYVLLPGNPERAKILADLLDERSGIHEGHPFVSYSGHLSGERVSVVATGIGGPAVAVAVECLSERGAEVFVRVGSSGAMQSEVNSGDLVVAEGAVRDEGTSRRYAPISTPAVSDQHVTMCLVRACEDLNLPHHLGIVHSKDSFYAEWTPEEMPISYLLADRWNAWLRCNVLCSEMEMAALLTVSASTSTRAGGILISLRDEQPQEPLCEAAVSGLRNLIKTDRAHSTAS